MHLAVFGKGKQEKSRKIPERVQKMSEILRLDRYLTAAGVLSRREAAAAVRKGLVKVNGAPEKDPGRHVDPEKDRVLCQGKEVLYRRTLTLMLNKPADVVSATEDGRDKTVLDLLPAEYRRQGLFPCGRLDKDTLGLLLLTNDGRLSHALLSPKHHAPKTYRFQLAEPLPAAAAEAIGAGVALEDGSVTAPAELSLSEDGRGGLITLTEGKYHEIKRIFGALGNRVTYLERVSFAGIPLDPALPRGGFRLLTEEEEALLQGWLDPAET